MDPTPVEVVAVSEAGPDAVAIELATPPDFDARPGQFVKLTGSLDGGEESRFYTISSPDVEDSFEVTIGVDPEGTLGPWLAERSPGDAITVAGPFGNVHYEDDPRVVVLAGGPGIGPAVGLAERAMADGGEAGIVYRDADPMHQDRLAALAAAGADVFVLGTDDEMAAAVGAVLTGEEGEQVFVYGFADFLDAATTAIDAAGGDAGAAKVENFG